MFICSSNGNLSNLSNTLSLFIGVSSAFIFLDSSGFCEAHAAAEPKSNGSPCGPCKYCCGISGAKSYGFPPILPSPSSSVIATLFCFVNFIKARSCFQETYLLFKSLNSISYTILNFASILIDISYLQLLP